MLHFYIAVHSGKVLRLLLADPTEESSNDESSKVRAYKRKKGPYKSLQSSPMASNLVSEDSPSDDSSDESSGTVHVSN